MGSQFWLALLKVLSGTAPQAVPAANNAVMASARLTSIARMGLSFQISRAPHRGKVVAHPLRSLQQTSRASERGSNPLRFNLSLRVNRVSQTLAAESESTQSVSAGQVALIPH